MRALDQAVDEFGLPAHLVMDNGPEFTSRLLDEWAYARGVQLHFIRPGKPVENAYAESFNGRFRDEWLNQHSFADLDEARALIADFKDDYNDVRPHTSLGGRTPAEVAASRAG